MNRLSGARLINFIFILLQSLLAIAFLPQKKYLNSLVTVFVVIFYLLFLLYEHKKGICISHFIRISVVSTLFANNFLGDYMQLYEKSVYFDKLLHLYGTFSFALFFYSIAEKEGFFNGITEKKVFIFVLLFGSFIGTVFEIAEFIADVLFKTKNQNSIADNNIDMLCNILGSILAGFIIRCTNKNKSIQ